MRCKKCTIRHNIGGFNGASMTLYTCILCGKTDIHNTSDPPKLCDDCMKQAIKDKSRCHWCGSLFIKKMGKETSHEE